MSKSSPFSKAIFQPRDRQELVEQVPEKLARGREPAGDQIAHHRSQLARGEPLTVDLELEQLRRDVVARAPSSLLDTVVDVARELWEPLEEALDALSVTVGAGKPTLDEVLGPGHD